MIAVARATPSEQVFAIVSRAWPIHVSETIAKRCRCGSTAAGASLVRQAPSRAEFEPRSPAGTCEVRRVPTVSESAFLKILHRLDQLFASVHHERAVTRHGLVQRLASYQDSAAHDILRLTHQPY
jgi:hypothetical protein